MPNCAFQRKPLRGSAELGCYAVSTVEIIARLKIKQLIKTLEQDGWYQHRQRGSHRQFKHPVKSGTVKVSGKPNVDTPPGTLNNVMKQTGLKK